MTKTKSQKKRAKAQANGGKPKVEITVNPKKAGSLVKRKPVKVVSRWLRAVLDPWNHEAVSIPDEHCQPSLKYTSRYSTVMQTDAVTANTAHGMLIGVGPYLTNAITGCGAVAKRGWESATNRFSTNIVTDEMPNVQAMFPQVTQGQTNQCRNYEYRVSAIGVKIRYEGAELNRAGTITVGLADPMTLQAGTTVNTQTANPLNAVFGYTYATTPGSLPQEVKNRMRRIATVRAPDGTISATWIPTGVPQYVPFLQTNAGEINDYFQFAGPSLLIMIEGDMTSSASIAGNTYSLDVIMHLEVLPLSRYVLVVQPTPSPFDPEALAEALNGFQTMTCAIDEDRGGKLALDDGHDSTVGSAWEGMGRLFNALPSLNDVVGGVQQAAQNPILRYAVRSAMNRRRNRQMMLEL